MADHVIFTPERQRIQAEIATEEALAKVENPKRSARQYAKLLSYMKGLVEASDLPRAIPAQATERGSVTNYNAAVHQGDQVNSTSVAHSTVGAVGTGAGASASGSVAFTGDTPISQADFKRAVSSLQASLLGMQDQLDKLDSNLYEDASNILLAVRRLQLQAGAVPETVVPAATVHAVVIDAFEEETIQAVVKQMKPGALARVAETTKDLVKLASDPVVKLVGGALAQSVGAFIAGGG